MRLQRQRPGWFGERSGFTLSEAVLAAVLLAVGLAVFVTAFSFSAKCIYNARNQMFAMNQAREQVESRRVYAFRDPLLDAGTYSVTGGTYRAQVTISMLRTNEKLVEVDVPWSNLVLRAASTAHYETVIADAIH